MGRFPGGAGGLGSTVGFDRGVLLSQPRTPDEEASLRNARLDFVRQVFMRLPREIAGVILSPRVARDGGQERLAIDVAGPDGFQATLLADRDTCVPVAFQYPGNNRVRAVTARVDLSEYRVFAGIRFPTALKTSNDGQPYAEESVTSVEVNAPDADSYFAPGR